MIDARIRLGIFDGPAVDNWCLGYALTKLFGRVPVVVTGRHRLSAEDEMFTLGVNARRFAGFASRQCSGLTNVYSGLVPPRTIVPHAVHIDEARCLDPHNDRSRNLLAGDFAAALDALANQPGMIDLYVGGPLTEVAAILRDPRFKGRLGILVCQLGLFGDVPTMAGGGLTFNSAADPDAVREVLCGWPGSVFMVPTNITKQYNVGFDVPTKLRRIGVNLEICDLYDAFYEEALEPRGERVYPHDVHVAFLGAQLNELLDEAIYKWEEVRVNNVDPEGRIDVAFDRTSLNGSNRRYVVTAVDPASFLQQLATTLF